jgi:hypothetical protein
MNQIIAFSEFFNVSMDYLIGIIDHRYQVFIFNDKEIFRSNSSSDNVAYKEFVEYLKKNNLLKIEYK